MSFVFSSLYASLLANRGKYSKNILSSSALALAAVTTAAALRQWQQHLTDCKLAF